MEEATPPPSRDPIGPVPASIASSVQLVALVILATVATLFALQWAKPVLIPVLMGVLLSYAVTPLAVQLERWRVPRLLGAGLVLSTVLGLAGWGVWALSDQADALLDTLPPVTAKMKELMQRKSATESTLKKVERAVAEIEAVATAPAEPPASAPAGVPTSTPQGVETDGTVRSTAERRTRTSPPAVAGASDKDAVSPSVRPRFDLRAYLLSGSLGVLILMGQMLAMIFIALFLVASGSAFRRKMVRIAGPQLSQKKVTIETLNEINDQIQRYLLLQLAMSAIVGVSTWLVFYAFGLKQSAVWGVVAAVTNLVPYVGALLVGVGAGVVAFEQFGTLEMALAICAASFAVRTINGNLLGPWLMGRASRMNPVVVFITVLLFAWLWGVWGLLLGVPILMVVKTVCDRVEGLKPVGELLAY